MIGNSRGPTDGQDTAPARHPRASHRRSTLGVYAVVVMGRGAVEREFGRLKHEYGLAPLRVRGLAKVPLHADLTMFGSTVEGVSEREPSRSRHSYAS